MARKLRNVLYANKQWAVTRYGLESLDRYYDIEKSRLGETQHWRGQAGRHLSFWIPHVCNKAWVDQAAFIDAFELALRLHHVLYVLDIEASKREIIPHRKRAPVFDAVCVA